jgi:hypothetical protein
MFAHDGFGFFAPGGVYSAAAFAGNFGTVFEITP